MRIARIYYPVTTLGAGKRVGIWVSGCEKRCKNCMSERLRDINAGVDMSVTRICESIGKVGGCIDGFTISGGEPFLQVDELCRLTARLSKEYTDDIIIFTGYTMEQLRERCPDALARILENVSVIIDGEYVDELNDGIGIRGSSNQRIHIFRHRERHEKLSEGKRSVQIIEHQRGITVIGIP